MAGQDTTTAFLFKEYDAAKELTFHVDGLRAKVTSYFIALAGLALTALSVLFSAFERNGNEELTRWVATLTSFGLAVLGVLVVLIVARLRRVQLEAFRIINNIREYVVGGDVELWNVVELSRRTLPKPRRWSGSHFWVASVQIVSGVGLAVGLYLVMTPIGDALQESASIPVALLAGIALSAGLDSAYLRLARPPARPEYSKDPSLTPDG